MPTAMAYVADVTTEENRGKGMGIIGAAVGLGFIFGPAIGGVFSKASLTVSVLDRRQFWRLSLPYSFSFSYMNRFRKKSDRTEKRTTVTYGGTTKRRIASVRIAVYRHVFACRT
nr:MFS transporter [Anoxybacillus sp. KU2-6(11)]